MSPDSRRALALQIEAEARLLAEKAHLEALAPRPDPDKLRALCAWLYRLSCELALLRGETRPPPVPPAIEAEALGYSADLVRWWRAREVASQVSAWIKGRLGR